jgi:hypothetical protein
MAGRLEPQTLFLILAAALVLRFLTTGGRAMLAMMGGDPADVVHAHDTHANHA